MNCKAATSPVEVLNLIFGTMESLQPTCLKIDESVVASPYECSLEFYVENEMDKGGKQKVFKQAKAKIPMLKFIICVLCLMTYLFPIRIVYWTLSHYIVEVIILSVWQRRNR